MYDFEIVIQTDRLNRKLEALKKDFPRLDVLKRTMSHFYVTLVCSLDRPLDQDEKNILHGYVADKIIVSFRCGKRD